MATLDEINGLYDVAGVNHILKTPGAYAEKAPIGLGPYPVPIKNCPQQALEYFIRPP